MSDASWNPRIAIGSDHAGLHVKEIIKEYFLQAEYQCDDVGTSSDESLDYPDFAHAAAGRVAEWKDDLGVLVCATGIGMAIAANKTAGIRAATVHDRMTSRLAREHNAANVLTLGARVLSDAEAAEVMREFLAAQFAGGRHQRRIDKITEMEQVRVR